MDSLTQIVLGAACGEMVLGKKIGNRAMVLGAIGGTIPDLDVLGNFFMGELDALAFHRGPSHSLAFAFTVPFLFGWMADRFYQSGTHQRLGYRILMYSLTTLLILASAGVAACLPLFAGFGMQWPYAIALAIITLILLVRFFQQYLQKPQQDIVLGWKPFAWLFFWSIVTHPILDAFTTFGTQLYLPFTDYRVAWNTIAVADPYYTIPFLLAILVAGQWRRPSHWRKIMTFIGIAWSCLYLGYTVGNKLKVNDIFEKSIAQTGKTIERYMTSPTIFTNALWYAAAETKDDYLVGWYSIHDDKPLFSVLESIPKRHELLAPYEKDEALRILPWFSKDYYMVVPHDDGSLYYYDLRFGSMTGEMASEKDLVFKFRLTPNANGGLDVEQERDNPRPEDMKEIMTQFFGRINGIENADSVQIIKRQYE